LPFSPPATGSTAVATLSLHDALPISLDDSWEDRTANLPTAEQFSVPSNFPEDLGAFDSQNGYDLVIAVKPDDPNVIFIGGTNLRSEEHTSELQSRENLVCRLLLEKKK